jgi:hypothetical protein
MPARQASLRKRVKKVGASLVFSSCGRSRPDFLAHYGNEVLLKFTVDRLRQQDPFFTKRRPSLERDLDNGLSAAGLATKEYDAVSQLDGHATFLAGAAYGSSVDKREEEKETRRGRAAPASRRRWGPNHTSRSGMKEAAGR